MSHTEKILIVLAGILLVVLSALSLHEYRESPEADGSRAGANPSGISDFDASFGREFKIGPFTTIAHVETSGGPEDNCLPVESVIVAALHDIKEQLADEHVLAFPAGSWETFEVNEQALAQFCNKNAAITLADQRGNHLLLRKIPFATAIPAGGTAADAGRRVHIDATLLPAGGLVPSEPTVSADVLIPDRYLDGSATSTPVPGNGG